MNQLMIPNSHQMTSGTQIATSIRNLSKANLILMAPVRSHTWGQFYHRPKAFNFTVPFQDTAAECLSDIKLNTATYQQIEHKLANKAQQENVFGLSDRVDSVCDLSAMDSLWRFILMVHDEKPDHPLLASYHQPMVKHDYIVEGYCVGEPVSATGVINPECKLVITNKRVIKHSHQMSPYGVEQIGSKITYDQYVINGNHLSGDENTRFYQLDLQACQRGIYCDENGSITTMVGNPSSSNYISDHNPKTMSPSVYDDRANLVGFWDKFVKSYEATAYNRSLVDETYGDGQTPPYLAENRMREAFYSQMVATSSVVTPGQFVPGPNEHEVMLMREIGAKYDVTPTVIDWSEENIESFSRSHNLLRDMFCQMLAETLIAYMSANSLSCFEFSFVSNFERGPHYMQHVCTPYAAASPVFGDMATISKLCRGVIAQLECGLFQSMFWLGGDFELVVKADIHGMIFIILNFKDHHEKISIPYQYPSFYTGMITSIVGDQQAAHTNINNFAGLMNVMTHDLTAEEEVDNDFYDDVYNNYQPNYPNYSAAPGTVYQGALGAPHPQF